MKDSSLSPIRKIFPFQKELFQAAIQLLVLTTCWGRELGERRGRQLVERRELQKGRGRQLDVFEVLNTDAGSNGDSNTTRVFIVPELRTMIKTDDNLVSRWEINQLNYDDLVGYWKMH